MVVRLATHAMGTRFELVLAGPGAERWRAAGEEAMREIELWHRLLTRFEPGGEIWRVNRDAAAGPVRVPREVMDVLELCHDLWTATGGLFDPALGAAMDEGLARAQTSTVTTRPQNASPDADRASMAQVVLDGSACTVQFMSPRVQLDLGAIAKGWALDCAAGVLREHGVTSALLHGGTSSVIAIGAPEGAEWWNLAVQGGPDAELQRVALCDGALGVSAPRGRTITIAGEPGGHVLDPRTWRSARTIDTAAVICCHDDHAAAIADAWSTALLVGGKEAACRNYGVSWALLTRGRWLVHHAGGAPSCFLRRDGQRDDETYIICDVPVEIPAS